MAGGDGRVDLRLDRFVPEHQAEQPRGGRCDHGLAEALQVPRHACLAGLTDERTGLAGEGGEVPEHIRGDQVVEVVEVVVEHPNRHAGLAGDGADAEPGGPVALDDAIGGGEQIVPRMLGSNAPRHRSSPPATSRWP